MHVVWTAGAIPARIRANPLGHQAQDVRLLLVLQTMPDCERVGPVGECSPSVHECVGEVEENQKASHISHHSATAC